METIKQIVEIKGVKFEVDLRTATRVEEFKIGQGVKILKKNYDSWSNHAGVIVGFDDFKTHPTIIVAYLNIGYNDAKIEFCYLNNESKDFELCAINEWDIPYSKLDILTMFNREIVKQQEIVRDLERKRNYFENMFGRYFSQVDELVTGSNG